MLGELDLDLDQVTWYIMQLACNIMSSSNIDQVLLISIKIMLS